jgi:hypothetical protein
VLRRYRMLGASHLSECSVEPNEPHANAVQQVQEHSRGRRGYHSVLEWLSEKARAQICPAGRVRRNMGDTVPNLRKRTRRRRKNSRVQQTARIYLTRVSTSRTIETCITIGARTLFTITVLFVLAYICLIGAICITLKRGTQSLEQDYPLTDPPNGNDRPHS